jgi:hypothetical protein
MNERLEVMLLESEGHLPDDGFTARVMSRLPPRKRAGSLRSLILAAGLAAGVVVLLAQAPAAEALLAAFREHARNRDLLSLLRLAPVLAAIGSLFWAWMSLGCEEA